jgi:hypothetical protein
VKTQPEEVLWVKIDHMRERGPYARRLEAWCLQLNLRAVLLTARDHGIHFLATGRFIAHHPVKGTV